MNKLNEETMTIDTDTELEEAWRTKKPGKIWNIDNDGVPPWSEILTEEAKHRFMEQGMFPEDVTHADVEYDDWRHDKWDPDEGKMPPGWADELYRTDPILAAGQRRRERLRGENQ